MVRMLTLLGVFLLVCTQVADAQVGTLRGRVVDAQTGETLPGVNLLLEGTRLGAASDIQGGFEIAAPAGAYNLVATFIGYQRLSLAVSIVGNQVTNVEVPLRADLLGLDEVLVVGFGTVSQRALTGSVARVESRELQRTVVNSFEQAMQGRVAGVTVLANNGKLGQGIQVRVRGTASVTAGNEPLYVVDGVPVITENTSYSAARTNPLAQLNINDIASIEVLKDASAAAIYGARGSNGVVLITTKSGLNGQTQFTVNFRRSGSDPTRRVELLNSREYVELFLEAAANSRRLDPSYDYVGDAEDTFDYLALGTDWRRLLNGGQAPVDQDWQDTAFRTGVGTTVDVSARGGNQNTQFFLSGQYSDEEGILVSDSYDRFSSRLNLDHQMNSRFRLGMNLSFAHIVQNRVPDDNAFSTPLQAIAQAPISPAFVPAAGPLAGGDYVPTADVNPNTLYFNGLLYFVNNNTRLQVKYNRSLANTYAALDILPGLTYRTELGVDVMDQNDDLYYGSAVADNTGERRGIGISIWNRIMNLNTNNYLNYVRSANNHSIDVTAGNSFQGSRFNYTFVRGIKFPNDFFQQVNGAAEITDGDGQQSDYRFLSYFARANYNYDSRYFLSFSGRSDGSSRFGDDNRYGFFPAASLGWVMTEEPFMRWVPFSYLKLRASYGLTGNAAIGNFPSLGLWGTANYGGTPGMTPRQIANPGLKWERTTQGNLGLDFAFFNDRWSGEFDVYNKDTRDLLLSVNLPGTSGFATQLQNVGQMNNRGFDFMLNGRILTQGPLTWTTSFNLNHYRNEVTNLNGQVITGGFLNRAIEGHAIGVFFGFQYAGVDPQTGDALYYINEKDANGNIVNKDATTTNPNAANRVVLGSPHPDFTGGWGNNLAFRGFELDFFFQFSQGNQVFDGGGRFKSANADYFDNQSRDQLKRWRQPGDVTNVPEARLYFANGTVNSSRYLYDASYIRLKNVSFAYNVPRRFLQQYQVQNARIYVNGTNLLTWTKYPWWDPEVNTDYLAGNISLGNEFYSAPQARTIAAGIQLTF